MCDDVQAQPTQRRKTTMVRLPLPKVSSRSRSRGAGWPIWGGGETATGGGVGVSQGWTVKGRFLTVIQAGQADLSSLVSKEGTEDREDFLEASSQGSLKESLEMPAFFRAILVARLENMVARWFGGSRPRAW